MPHFLSVLLILLRLTGGMPQVHADQSDSFLNVGSIMDGATATAAGSESFSAPDSGVTWRTSAGQSESFLAGIVSMIGSAQGSGTQSSHRPPTGGGGWYRPRISPAPSGGAAPAAPVVPVSAPPPPAAQPVPLVPVSPRKVPLKPAPAATPKRPVPKTAKRIPAGAPKTISPTVTPGAAIPGTARTGRGAIAPSRIAVPAKPATAPAGLRMPAPRPAVPTKDLAKTRAPVKTGVQSPVRPGVTQQKKPLRRPFAFAAALLGSVGSVGSAFLEADWATPLTVLLMLIAIACSRPMIGLSLRTRRAQTRARRGRRGDSRHRR